MQQPTSRPWLSAAIAGVTVVVAGIAGMILWGIVAEAPPPPPPAFQAMVIKPGNFLAEQVAEATAAGGKVPANQIDFQADVVTLKLADVAKASSGPAFIGLLRGAGVDQGTMDHSVILRSRDGEHITAASGDALGDDNRSVIIVPDDIVKMFDDERTAFQLIRMRISGLQ